MAFGQHKLFGPFWYAQEPGGQQLARAPFETPDGPAICGMPALSPWLTSLVFAGEYGITYPRKTFQYSTPINRSRTP